MYEVYDREQNAILALKILHGAGASRIERLKAEFRSLHGVTRCLLLNADAHPRAYPLTFLPAAPNARAWSRRALPHPGRLTRIRVLSSYFVDTPLCLPSPCGLWLERERLRAAARGGDDGGRSGLDAERHRGSGQINAGDRE